MMSKVSVAETETESSKVLSRDTGNRTQDRNSSWRAIHPKAPPAKNLKQYSYSIGNRGFAACHIST